MSREIFVFGSNLAGRHGKGAALFALKNHGAIYGQGHGLQGNSYGIPTKDSRLNVLSLETIEIYVQNFRIFAAINPQLTFNITRIGCGLAGYKDEQIAPMFIGCSENCKLPEEWVKVIKDLEQEHKDYINQLFT